MRYHPLINHQIIKQELAILEIEAEQRGKEYATAIIENNADTPTGRITVSEKNSRIMVDVAAKITGTAIPIDGCNTA